MTTEQSVKQDHELPVIGGIQVRVYVKRYWISLEAKLRDL